MAVKSFIGATHTFNASFVWLSIVIMLSVTGCGGGGGDAPSDTTIPVITILGENPASIVQGATYTDAGATATDNVDGSVSVTTSGTVDTSTIGTYTITYTATDNAGNTATATRTVNVTNTANLNGTVNSTAGSAADSDVNDPNASYAANNSPAQAQSIPNPVILGGYLNVAYDPLAIPLPPPPPAGRIRERLGRGWCLIEMMIMWISEVLQVLILEVEIIHIQ